MTNQHSRTAKIIDIRTRQPYRQPQDNQVEIGTMQGMAADIAAQALRLIDAMSRFQA